MTKTSLLPDRCPRTALLLAAIIVTVIGSNIPPVSAESSGAGAGVDTKVSRDEVPEKFDLQAELVKIRIKEYDLIRELERAKVDLPVEERRWAASRQKLENVTDADTALLEKIAALWSSRLYLDAKKSTLEIRMEILSKLREIWKWRHSVRTSPPLKKEILEWKNKAREYQARFEEERHLAESKLNENVTEREALNNKISSTRLRYLELHWLKINLRNINKRILVYQVMTDELNSAIRVADELHEDIKVHFKSRTLRDRIKEFIGNVLSLWNFEITRVENNPITIGKIIMAFIFFFLGLFLSRWISEWTGNRILTRIDMDRGAMDSIRQLLFYTLLILFTLISLRIVEVPLALLTVFGGAVAIGIGFGSQNIVNNFISGLILLIERPIKVGDYVEVDSMLGIVEHIDMRSTKVKTADNIHLVIPNSTFLEKNVINWTLSNKIIRAVVSVGVAYGSPVDEVTGKLLETVKSNEIVLASPEPVVYFTDFGDNALKFEIYFWMRLRNLTDRKRICSELRFEIDRLFREANITIAFPQRDIHLDTTRPMDIRVVDTRRE